MESFCIRQDLSSTPCDWYNKLPSNAKLDSNYANTGGALNYIIYDATIKKAYLANSTLFPKITLAKFISLTEGIKNDWWW